MTTDRDPERPWQPELIGVTPPKGEPGPLLKAAQATISALEQDGLLTGRHAIQVQAILDLAETLSREGRGKLTVAVGQGWRTLLDMIEQLPQPEVASTDAWDDMLRAFAAAELEARRAVSDVPAGDTP